MKLPRVVARRLVAAVAVAAFCAGGCAPGQTRVPDDLKLEQLAYKGGSFRVVRVNVKRCPPELFWRRADGTRYSTFAGLRSDLARSHRKLLFATDAGMFEPTMTPCGLHVEDGRELVPLNLRSGMGNFYLKPNGVFLIDSDGARVLDSSEYTHAARGVRCATQSGPLLVRRGQLHPALKAGSDSRTIRSGVGIVSAGEIVFVLSRDPVNFHDFAILLRDRLGCADALYLDGAISQFFLPGEEVGATDGNFAGILAVTGSD